MRQHPGFGNARWCPVIAARRYPKTRTRSRDRRDTVFGQVFLKALRFGPNGTSPFGCEQARASMTLAAFTTDTHVGATIGRLPNLEQVSSSGGVQRIDLGNLLRRGVRRKYAITYSDIGRHISPHGRF